MDLAVLEDQEHSQVLGVWAVQEGGLGFQGVSVDCQVGSMVQLGLEEITTMEVTMEGQQMGMEMNLEDSTAGIVGLLQTSMSPQTGLT